MKLADAGIKKDSEQSGHGQDYRSTCQWAAKAWRLSAVRGQLAENLNVGKSSVREATKMLEAVGVVEIIKGRGCRIRTTIDSDALNPLAYQLILQSNTSHEKLVEFRRVIESTVSCLAVKPFPRKRFKIKEHLPQHGREYVP